MNDIDDFVTVVSYIDGEKEEYSGYATVMGFFTQHFKNAALGGNKGVGDYDAEVRIGSKIKIHPSDWTIDFGERKNIPIDSTKYEKEYTIENIEVDFFDHNPRSDSKLPHIVVKIYLKS